MGNFFTFYYLLFIILFHTSLVFYHFHLEVASGPFCLLVNSPWLLVFALCLFFVSLHLVCSFHFWFRDLLREFTKKYEILLLVLFLVFLLSEALLFISFFWASFHSLSSPTLGICPGEG